MRGVSVIIPCYKRKKELKECLKSLAKSEGLNKEFDYEIFIIESSEQQVLKGLISEFKDLKLKHFRLKKRGISKAKNFGAEKAKYEVLVFCDSDVKVEKDTLLQTFSTFQDNAFAGMVSGKVFWQEQKRLDRPSPTDRFFKYKGSIFAECFYGRYLACLKKAFFKVKGFDAQLFNMRGEGTDLSIKFWRAGYPLLFNPKIAVEHFREAPLSVTRKIAERNVLMFNSIMLLLYKYQSNLKNSPYHSSSLYLWTKKLLGNSTPFLILESWAQSLEWTTKNYKNIKESREEVPKQYDFKPFEVCSQHNRALLNDCLKKAPRRLKSLKGISCSSLKQKIIC